MKEGYIAIQAEATATMLRKIEVLNLVGCMAETVSVDLFRADGSRVGREPLSFSHQLPL